MIAIVPARAGSKGIKSKNIKPFCDRPLLAWTIESALNSNLFTQVLVTTDSEEIRDVALSFGATAPFIRPTVLASDHTPTAPVIAHALRWITEKEGCPVSHVFVLEPTSPIRRSAHLVAAAQLFHCDQVDTVVSISAVPHHYIPSKLVAVDSGNGNVTGWDGTPIGKMVHRRQNLPTVHYMNGSVWACKSHLLEQTPPTIWGDQVRSIEVSSKYVVDLDTPDDWAPAEARMRELLEAGEI